MRKPFVYWADGRWNVSLLCQGAAVFGHGATVREACADFVHGLITLALQGPRRA